MTKPDSILKSRDITLLTKIRLVKAMVFTVLVYGCKIWTIKKKSWAPKNWCFWTFVVGADSWESLEQSSWVCKEGRPLITSLSHLFLLAKKALSLLYSETNKSILKEINPEYSLGLMLKVKLQYFGHLMRRADSLEKTLMLGKVEGRRRRGRQRMRWLDGITELIKAYV